MDVAAEESLPYEPVEVVDEDGRVVRKTITVRKRIVRRIIYLPDGTKQEVEEEVPVTEAEERPAEVLELVEREVAEPSKPEEPEQKEVVPKPEEVVVPMEVATEESLPYEPEQPSYPAVEEPEEPVEEDGRVVRKTITVRKRIVRRIIRLPDGTKQEVEEEVPVEEAEERPAEVFELVEGEIREPGKPEEPQFVAVPSQPDSRVDFVPLKEPRQVERVYVTRILRQTDGTERVLETSETVSPMQPEPEDEVEEREKVEEVKDRLGRVKKTIHRSPAFVIRKKKVTKESRRILPHGKEEPEKTTAVEPEETQEVEAPVIRRVVNWWTRDSDEDGEPKVTEKREKGKNVRIVKRKLVETRQQNIRKKVTKKPDGKQEGPVEEEAIKPVEPVSYRIVRKTVRHGDGTVHVTEEPDFTMPDDAKEPTVEEKKVCKKEWWRGKSLTHQKTSTEGRSAKEEEVVVVPMEVAAEESLPYEPVEVVDEDGRVVRKTITVRKRIVRRIIYLPDGTKQEVEEEVPVTEAEERPAEVLELVEREVAEPSKPEEPEQKEVVPKPEEVVVPMEVATEESLPYEPEQPSYPAVEEPEEPVEEDGRVVRKTITVRKRIVRRIIRLPDGTKQEVEEEVPVEEAEERPAEVFELVEGEIREPGKPEEPQQTDGTERVLETSETVSPMQPEPEDEVEEREKVEEVKDRLGRVKKTIHRSPAFVIRKKKVTKESRRILPHGKEEPEKTTAVEPEETQEVEAPVIRRVVKLVTRDSDGKEEVVEKTVTVKPFEIIESKEDGEPKVTEKREKGKNVRIVKRKLVETRQQNIRKKVTKKPDGKQEGPVEEEAIKPVEPVSYRIVRKTVRHGDGTVHVTEEPDFTMPDDAKEPTVEEVKDRRGQVVRRITTKPVPMLTRRKVYRTIIIAPDGTEESVQERVVERQEPDAPEQPAPKEEVPKKEEVVVVPMEVAAEESLPYEPVEVVDEDGRVVRKTITVRKRIVRRIIYLPDGTKQEVEEEVPVTEAEERPAEVLELVEREVAEPSKPEEPEQKEVVPKPEEVVVPMEVATEESLPYEPEQPSYPAVEEPEEPVEEDGRVVRKTITVRKRIVRRIIRLPDGTKQEVEEEVPVEEAEERPAEVFELVEGEIREPGKPEEPQFVAVPSQPDSRVDFVPLKEPRQVERVYVTRILRQTDGTERVLETSETVSPMQPEPEDEVEEREKVEEVKDRLGRVKKTIHRSPAFVIRKKKVTKESRRILPHGKEEPEKTTAVEPEETQEVEAPVIRRVVKLVTRDSDGKEEVVEKTVTVKPFEIIESKEDGEPKVTEKREKGKNVRIVKRKLVETRQQNIRKKVTKKPDGKQEGPVEEEAIKPVEPVSYRIVRKTVRHGDGTVHVTEEPDFTMPDDAKEPTVEEVKDRRGQVVRRITTKPVPMLTRRKVYRTIIIAPDGTEESVQERVVERQEPDAPEQPAPKEEVPKKEEVVVVPMEVAAEESLPYEPVEVVDEDGRVVRKTITVRKRIVRRIIYLPDGTKQEVEEEVPVTEAEERPAEVLELVEREVAEPSKPEEPEQKEVVPKPEEVVVPMEVATEESLPYEPEQPSYPAVEEPEEPVEEDGRVVRKTITVRKRIVRRIIRLPDGTKQEVEEEVPVEEAEERPAEVFELVEGEIREPGKPEEPQFVAVPSQPDSRVDFVPLKEPRQVERVYVTRILRQTDGTERVLETSETVSPMQPEPEDEVEEREKVEEVKDRLGRKKVTKESRRILPHGKEEPEKTTAVEPEETQEVEAPVIRRVVKLVTRDSDGKEEVVEKTVTVKPFEIIESKEDGEPKVTEKREKGKNVRIVKRKLVETRQQNIRKKVTKKPDGKQEGPVEEEAIKPVEPVSYRIVRKTVRHGDGTVHVTEEPDFTMPDDAKEPTVEEVKDRRGQVVRRITTKPVPMLTRRKVYRTIIIAPDGTEESVQERVVERQEPDAPEQPAPKEEVPKKEEVVVVPMEVAAEESLPYEPVEVVDEDGRVVRKTITVRKRIVRRIIYLPDGTKQEVEEEVPVTEAEERPAEVLELVEREVAEPSKPEEPEQKEVVPKPEEVVVPMEVATEESLPYEPEQPSYPAVEEPEEPVEEDGRVVRKTITVRKRIVRRIIRLPDGTKQEVEEEVPVEEAEERPAEVFELVEGEIREPGKPEEPQFVAVPSQPDSRVDFVPLKEPRQVERVYVTRILRQTDGTERVLETSETVSPMQPEPEDEVEEREKVEEVKDRLGRVKKTIHRSPAFVIRKKKVTKESRRILPHGKEEPEKTTAVEPEETQEVEAPVIRRVVKLVTRDSDGKEEVVEKTVTVKPFEIIESKEDGEPKVTEKREKGKNVRIVKRKLVETRQQNIRKKVTKKPDGKQEGPVEEEAIKPVEPVSYRIVRKTVRHGDGTVHVTEEPDFTMPDDAKEPTVEEVKDRRGQVVRRITTKPVPMLTRRKVYRTIIIAPDGTEESVQERVVERQEPDAPEQPAPKEEVPKKEEVVVVPMEVAAEESLPYEPVEVVDEDGRVVRKTITVRKRIVRRIIYLPDGTKQEVEEEVPVTEAEERPAEVLELVEREVAEPSKPEEPEQKEVVPKPEEVVVPMEVATEESLPYEPEQPSYPAVEEPEEPVEEDGRVVRKTITVRKRIVRRIIRLPDGTKQEVEEEVPVEEAEERPAEVFELVEGEIREPGKPEEPQFVAVPSQPDSRVDFVPLKEPRQVERVYVTRILRQTDGTERVLETSETVSPMQPEPEDEVEEREKVEEVKDRLGRVKKTIHRSPAFVIRKKKVTKESRRILPHGKEEPEKTTAVEPEETQEVEAPVIRRVVKLVTRDSDGKEEVVEKTVTVKPFEIIESKEDGEPKVTEKREKGKNVRIVKRKLVETRQQNIRKKVTKKPDGKQEGPVEEEAIKPVEPVSYRIVRKTVRHGDGTVHVTEEPDFTMPDDAKEPTVEEVKDRRGQVVRRITTKPVPMLTRRKVRKCARKSGERQEPDAPEQPAPKEEVPKKEEVVVVPMEVAAEESLPYEPVEVVDEDGRVVRKTITVRKRIVRRIIYLPDGTKQEVEEEVPVTEAEERPAEVLELVEREVAEPSKPEEPEQKEVVPKPEEVVVPMEVATEESLPYEPEQPSYPAVEEPEEPVEEDGRVVRKTITVRKRIVRRIIRLPDGTKQEVEEEVPVEEAEERPAEVFELVEGEIREPGKPEEPQFVAVPSQPDSRVDFVPLKEPRQVERVYVTRILRQTDGTERVLETSETVSPMQPEPEDEVEEREKVEEVKDRLGRVKKTIHRSPAFVIRKKKVTKESRRILPHGKEEPEKTTAVEPEETQEVEAPVIRRVVKLVTRDSDGKEEVVEKTVTVKPFEIIESKEDGEPKVTEKREKGKNVRIVKRKLVETRQQNIRKKVTKKPDGKQEGPVEEEAIKPVEPVSYRIVRKTVRHGDGTVHVTEEPDFTMPDDAKEPTVEEVKDRRGQVVRRITTKPVPMLTRRKVYRTIIIAPDGTEESVQERVVERQEPDAPEQPAPKEEVPKKEEVVVVPMEVAAEESLPYEPVEVVDEDGRVVRKTITVRKRIVRRIIYLPDGTKQEVEEEVPVTEAEERPAEVLELVEREVAEPSKPEEPEQKEVVPKPEEVVVPMEVATEESLPYEPEQPSYPAVEEPEEPVEEDGRVVRKTITVRKRIVRRIIRLPDGTKQEVEEEVPVEEAEERPAEVFELVEGEIREPGKPEEPQFVAVPSQPDSRVDFVPLKEPRQVERVYVTRILRQTDGTERVLETSETVSPMQPEPEDEVEEREKVEEVKDRLGRVKKTIHRSPAFVIRKKKVTKESRRILPHGKEEPEKTTAVEPEETQEVEAPVIRRVVKLVTRDSDGKEEVVEKTVTVKPFEIIESKEDGEPKVTEKREKGKNVRIVKRKLVETRQQNIRKKVTKKPDGKQEGPVEEEAIKPVEPVSYRIVRKTVRHGDGTVHVTEEPDFTMPDDAKEPTVEEVKDRREESVQERVVERQEPDAPEQPAPKEEVPKKEEVVVVPMEVAAEESLPYEPVEVVDEDGRVVRKTITVRKRIVRRIIYLPDGTKQEVEEEVPVTEAEERPAEVLELVEREVAEPSKPEEPEQKEVVPKPEEVVVPMEVATEESLPYEPEQPSYPAVEEPEEPVEEDGRVVRKTITVRKRIVRRIIRLPDGTKQEVEEEVPVEEAEERPAEVFELVEGEIREPGKPEEPQFVAVPSQPDSRVDFVPLKEPRQVERVYVTRILRQTDGTERVLETSETVSPMQPEPEDEVEEREKVEEVKDRLGRVKKTIHRSPAFVIRKKKVTKESRRILPHGKEEPEKTTAVEPEETQEVEAPVIRRVVKLVTRDSDGKEEVVEKTVTVKPFEIIESKEDGEPKDREKGERQERAHREEEASRDETAKHQEESYEEA
eukprot:gene6572-7315_t